MAKMRVIGLFFGLMLVTTLTLIAGCQPPGPVRPTLGTVTGTVTMDGKPLADVLVTFEPQAGGRQSMGTTNAQGVYELTYDVETKGAVVGSHRVTVTTPGVSEAPDPSGEAKDPVPAKYNTESTLVEEVKAGANTIDLELTSS